MTIAARRHLFVLAGGMLLGAALAAQSPAPAPGPAEIHTDASAQRSVRPDLAVFTLTFTGIGKTPGEAGQAVAARADTLRRALQALGIPHDSLMIGSRWYWWRGRVETIYGPSRYIPAPAGRLGPGTRVQDTLYRATDAIQVRTHDLTKVGPAIDAALALDITNISDIQFFATNTDAARTDALREATTSVRQQAEVIATADGARLGRTLSLSTGYDFGVGGVVSGMSVRGGTSSTEIVQPLIPVTVTVTGRWELIDKQ
ncbi:MAG TPA: SIMPL domain-containing protein [Gemmatimonadales bacterium]|nr:SIMPL domain-containing protein [Gemmatimonadales bacterium]